ncbi:MAG: phytoene desaturase family protein [Bacteroidales bacterium]
MNNAKQKKHIAVIGAGFSSLSAACYLAREGHRVEVFEKNATPGGRARQYKEAGFTFDMGPTWYWMPDVFEKFFADFGRTPADYYRLHRLDPAYKVVFGQGNDLTIPGTTDRILDTFESAEKGAAKSLGNLLEKARFNYRVAMDDVVYKPGKSPLELVTRDTVPRLGQFVRSISHLAAAHFDDPRLREIIEFPVLFLGAKPSDIPAFYSFMNYADFGLGTWHPEGGMYSVVEGMLSLAGELGVTLHTGTPVTGIETREGKATGIRLKSGVLDFDLVVSGADYHHTESMLDPESRGYSEHYWRKRTFAPSALMFYLGVNTKIQGIEHHTLFFDAPFGPHAHDIYDDPKWPENPLFYASIPSRTDSSLAPAGKDALILLIPLAPGLNDGDNLRETYFHRVMDRFESHTGQDIRNHLDVKRSYGVRDFALDYNSYKGNAYGLANILRQTAFLRPKLKSRKVGNLYFTGQLTVPGPGVPPSLISGKVVSQEITNDLNRLP